MPAIEFKNSFIHHWNMCILFCTSSEIWFDNFSPRYLKNKSTHTNVSYKQSKAHLHWLPPALWFYRRLCPGKQSWVSSGGSPSVVWYEAPLLRPLINQINNLTCTNKVSVVKKYIFWIWISSVKDSEILRICEWVSCLWLWDQTFAKYSSSISGGVGCGLNGGEGLFVHHFTVKKQ